MSIQLAGRLKQLRAEFDESLQDVASAVDASKAHIWELETGRAKNPSIDLVRRLAEHFRVSVGWLIGEEPDAAGVDEALLLYKAARGLSKDDLTLLQSIIESMKQRNNTPK